MKSPAVNNKHLPWFVSLSVFLWIYVIFISIKSENSYEIDETGFNLPNIAESEQELKDSKSNQIFFIESNLESVRNLENPRQACR